VSEEDDIAKRLVKDAEFLSGVITSMAVDGARMKQALTEAKYDLENCDWSCEVCQHDYGMTDTFAYQSILRGLGESETTKESQ